MDTNHASTLDGLDSVLNSLYSPGLNRYMLEGYGMSNEEIDVQFAHFAQDSAPYRSTRSRAPTAPFSPLRVPESRFGQQYYVPAINTTDPSTSSHHQYQQPTAGIGSNIETTEHTGIAPVLHIPEDEEMQSGNQSDASVDEEYNNFLQSLINPSDMIVEQDKTKKLDPPYYFPKRKTPTADETYNRSVTKNECKELFNDLKKNPVPGLPLDADLILMEPPMTTRSAARKSSDVVSPTPSMSPAKTNDNCQASQLYFSSTAHHPSGSAVTNTTSMYQRVAYQTQPVTHNFPNIAESSARTRSQLRSPQKPSGSVGSFAESFKKPLPVVKPRGKVGKGLLTKENELQPVSGKKSHPEENSPQSFSTAPEEPATVKQIKKRFDSVAVKFRQFCEGSDFSEDHKEFVIQMMNKAINRTDDKEAVILTEFVMRTVALVTGQSCALKAEPFIKEARKADLPFTSVVFGVLIQDDSPLILSLMPHLFGKTRLIKAMQKESTASATGKQGEELAEAFQAALRVNDHPYRFPKPDYGSTAAWKLGLTGKEGLFNPHILEFMTEEVILNPEKIILETSPSLTPRSSLGADSNVKPVSVVISNTQRSAPDRLMDVSQVMNDGNSNDSQNSTHNLLNTGHIAEGGPDTPGSVLDFNALFAGVPTPPSAFAYENPIPIRSPLCGDAVYYATQPPVATPRPSRRVPLLSSPLPLTISPSKSAGSPFAAAMNSPSRNTLLSPGRARYEFRSTAARVDLQNA